MRGFRWSNVPIPEGHVLLLVLGVALHVRRPWTVSKVPRLTRGLGWPLLGLGVLLAGWAVVTSEDMDLGRPTRLVVSGPFGFSRNPMYVAWTLTYVGTSLVVNTWWLMLLLPLLLAFTHVFVVQREEQRLEHRFGDQYRQYRRQVRRYV